VPDWFVILIAAAALLLATWCVGEWICRRISARYAERNRRWRGLGPDDGPDGDSASE
jgi:hypothetical protein